MCVQEISSLIYVMVLILAMSYSFTYFTYFFDCSASVALNSLVLYWSFNEQPPLKDPQSVDLTNRYYSIYTVKQSDFPALSLISSLASFPPSNAVTTGTMGNGLSTGLPTGTDTSDTGNSDNIKDDKNSNSNSNVGTIVGVVCGVVGAVCVAAVVFFVVMRKRRQGKQGTTNTEKSNYDDMYSSTSSIPLTSVTTSSPSSTTTTATATAQASSYSDVSGVAVAPSHYTQVTVSSNHSLPFSLLAIFLFCFIHSFYSFFLQKKYSLHINRLQKLLKIATTTATAIMT